MKTPVVTRPSHAPGPPRRTLALPLLLFLLLVPPPPDAGGSASGPASSLPSGSGDAATPDPLRFADRVLVPGAWLPGLLGIEMDRIRVLRFQGGLFRAIRFQIDERTEEGDWVFPHGKRANGDRGNGRFDPQDVLLFMARDTGERANPGNRPPGCSVWLELGLEDPADHRSGWCYVAAYAGRPPPLSDLPDYVHYDADREVISSACTRAEYLITQDGLHTTFYLHHSTPPEAGGTGENLVDRLKFRIDLRFFFNLIPLSLTEEMLRSDVVAYIRGPVRVVRRYEQFVQLPFGVRGVRTFADVEVYEAFSTVPIEFQIPRGIHRIVSSAVIRYGTDYAPNVIGSLFRNSENPEGLVIDGRMSEAEKRFAPAQDRWRVFYGPYGVLMTRTVYPPELLKMVDVKQRYLDDATAEQGPERYPGSIGYAYTELNTRELRAGRYRLFLDFYFPPHYRPGDEERYLRFRDVPLRIRVGEETHENPLYLFGEVGDDF